MIWLSAVVCDTEILMVNEGCRSTLWYKSPSPSPENPFPYSISIILPHPQMSFPNVSQRSSQEDLLCLGKESLYFGPQEPEGIMVPVFCRRLGPWGKATGFLLESRETYIHPNISEINFTAYKFCFSRIIFIALSGNQA